MSGVKSLAKDTAIYGLSSIIGRFLNWCLVPLYTIVFPQEQYGIVTYVYSVVAIAMIVLTYGMETGFFRFANHDRWKDPMQVYSTALISLMTSGTLFLAVLVALLGPITRWMECDGHPSYVLIMGVCTAIDAFSALPFSYLRYRNRAARFATLKLVNIGLNIGLNLFFILLCPAIYRHNPGAVSWCYDPTFGIGYIFLSNLIATIVTLMMLTPELRGFKYTFCRPLWLEMLRYSAPLLVLGIAGIMNQTLDKILFPALSTAADPMAELGVYGANYKIAIIMVMFLQAFRFAYEPFIFSQNKQQGIDAKQSYAQVMKYFLIVSLVIFMGVMYYLDIIKYFISPRYFSGLAVVPIVMGAELMFGIFFNLSVWYKITDRTHWGTWFSLIGLAVTVGLNVLLVPRYGYMGCAWAAFGCYGTMMVLSYVVGQRKYPIAYPMRSMAWYVFVAATLYVLGIYVVDTPYHIVNWLLRAMLLGAFIAFVMKREQVNAASLIKPLLSKLHR